MTLPFRFDGRAILQITPVLSNTKIMLAGLLFLSLALVAASEGKHWALVVAGSNGWDNYRHQVQYTVLGYAYIEKR